MRPRPDEILPRRARAQVAAALAVIAWTAFGAPHAFAQGGAGAERYEVTITPPKRPGTEQPADAGVPAAVPAEPGSASDSATAPASSGVPPSAGVAEAPHPGGSAPAATAKTATPPDPATVRATANLPMRTLQVGAYRQRSRADSLHDALAPTFQDVTIVEVQSGGEPLYRVNVGRLPRGPGLEDLKRRLTAAGFPAFEVLAPPPSATN